MPRTTKNTKETGNLSFEDVFIQLEETVQALETGGLSLEEATRLFENGLHLARICNEHLSVTELKISRLQTAFGEQMQFIEDGSEPTK